MASNKNQPGGERTSSGRFRPRLSTADCPVCHQLVSLTKDGHFEFHLRRIRHGNPIACGGSGTKLEIKPEQEPASETQEEL